MSKKIYYLLIIICVLFSLTIGLKTRVLVIKEATTKQIVYQQQVTNQLKFAIKYTHSVEQTPVWDYFKTSGNEIILTSTKYESYGAGLPFLKKNDYIVKDDKFMINNINTRLKEIPLRISDYAQHKFLINEAVYKLYQLTKTENLVLIRIEEKNLFQYLLREVELWLMKKN